MARSKLILLGLVAAGLTLYLQDAQAGSIRVFVMASTSTLSDNNSFTVDAKPYKSGYAGGGKVILGGEYSLSKLLGVEGAYGYGNNNLRVTNVDTRQQIGYPVGINRVSSDLVLRSPLGMMGLRPYLLAGLEYDRLGPNSEARTTASSEGFAGRTGALGASNKIGANYGGGLEWSLVPLVSLRLDLRDHVMSTPTYGLPSQASTKPIFPVSGSANDFEVAVGISIHIPH